MSLKAKLMDDLKLAMKEKNQVKKSVITLIRAAVKQYEVDNRVELDEQGVLDIVVKQMKQRKDALEEFTKAGREDLISQTQEEMEILKDYLPAQLSEEEIEVIVVDTIKEIGASSMKEMGKVMSALMPKVKGKADGKIVNELVKKHLQ
ncbi:GatB/YqeY domain-containing protein [Tepidibacter hydrothermalis]|uniref:GatB/YqeY domain-containing protein n=1 Tax=Tepidibacter hydrothermalis TaxID=3036126 RepID=A0ABY8EF53_9FIRM|nr:GatB/YqeY domain-containing protein [Tepidibacter hydrothermalis]WFD11585.1 GatB/YqeY domain-containing protein [Tepidibacter hydrothermalis]